MYECICEYDFYNDLIDIINDYSDSIILKGGLKTLSTYFKCVNCHRIKLIDVYTINSRFRMTIRDGVQTVRNPYYCRIIDKPIDDIIKHFDDRKVILNHKNYDAYGMESILIHDYVKRRIKRACVENS